MEHANEVALRDRLNGSVEFILQNGTVELGGHGQLILFRSRMAIGTWLYICPTFYLQPVGRTEPAIYTAHSVERAYQITLELLAKHKQEAEKTYAMALDYQDRASRRIA